MVYGHSDPKWHPRYQPRHRIVVVRFAEGWLRCTCGEIVEHPCAYWLAFLYARHRKHDA